MNISRSILIVPVLCLLLIGQAWCADSPAQWPEGVSAADRLWFEGQLADLQRRTDQLRTAHPELSDDLKADARLFQKMVRWGLRFEQRLGDNEIVLLKKLLSRSRQRLEELEHGTSSWNNSRGRVLRGYQSRVDDSIQPFGLVIPKTYQPGTPMRLDVVLHGSSRPGGLSEARILGSFDSTNPGATAPEVPYIELHPLGRVENCYRWAGETDVFEAIEAVCRHYTIDRRRIVLRGMSMGASGTWHLGLKHPGYFAALGPYCGYVDTHRFSETPIAGFVKVGRLPDGQERTLRLLDSIHYAANTRMIPTIAAMGEKDPFFDAHELMRSALRGEGLDMVNLISPGTGHVIDPVTFREQMEQIGRHVAQRPTSPDRIQFVTWSLKYPRCEWVTLLGITRHYERTELEIKITPGGELHLEQSKNVERFSVERSALPLGCHTLIFPGGRLEFGRPAGERLAFLRKGDRWKVALDNRPNTGKIPGCQGPIDDAFTSRFVCVRGTGTPWQPAVQAWAERKLAQFAHEWSAYFRGDLPVKNDTDLTPEDLRDCNLILFGDPGSNRWIRKALANQPIEWNRREVRVGRERFPSVTHLPTSIYPSPFSGAQPRYVVVNSGHTFRENDLAKLNYLLFPRCGDWAVLNFTEQADSPFTGAPKVYDRVALTGFFDERWKLKTNAPGRDPP